MRAFTAAILLFWMTGTAWAQIYEWYDEDGQRHFSDRKPVGVAYRIVGVGDESKLSTYTPAPIPPTIQQPPDSNRESPSDASSVRRSGEPSAAEGEREQACADYLRRLDAIQEALRAGYSEPRGNRLRAQRQTLQLAYRRDCT